MTDVGQGWLMATLSTSPLLVALLLTAESMPFFVLGLPAGAFADIIDRRRLLMPPSTTRRGRGRPRVQPLGGSQRLLGMRILLVNVPHPSIGSRIPDDHLPPLGLLAIGGSLIDAGHDVKLIDAEFGPVPLPELVNMICGEQPEAVLFGHSGSTSGHPVIAEVARGVSRTLPDVHIIYGGVYPTYHLREILAEEPYVTAIVRGEGEETVRQLAAALKTGARLD